MLQIKVHLLGDLYFFGETALFTNCSATKTHHTVMLVRPNAPLEPGMQSIWSLLSQQQLGNTWLNPDTPSPWTKPKSWPRKNIGIPEKWRRRFTSRPCLPPWIVTRDCSCPRLWSDLASGANRDCNNSVKWSRALDGCPKRRISESVLVSEV